MRPLLDAFQKSIASLDQYDWIIFTSPQAVYKSKELIQKYWPQFPENVKIAALGGGTAKALRQAQLPVDSYPVDDWCSEGLLNDASFQNLLNKKIALIRGDGGRNFLAETLVERGAELINIIAYQRCLPNIPTRTIEECVELIRSHHINAVICTSGEILHNLKILLEEAWDQLQIMHVIVVSERMEMIAEQLGFKCVFKAKNANVNALMDILEELICQQQADAVVAQK